MMIEQPQQRALWSRLERECLHLLQQRNTVASLLQVHAFMLRHALETNVNLLTKFISTCGSLALAASRPYPDAIVRHARRVFDCRPHKDDEFLCNAMINAHLSIHQYVQSFTLYRDLRRETNFTPDRYTFTALAKCCALDMGAREGEEIHSTVLKFGVLSNLYVSTALLDMYAKFGTMRSARKLFDEMTERSEVSWTALIVGYVKSGNMDESRKLFDEMPNKDTAVFNVMIDGSVKLGCMDVAQDLFDRMPNKDVISWTTMISGYCHNGDVDSARLLFDIMPEKNLFSWNAMIGGYSQNNHIHEALKLFQDMQSSTSVQPNEVTLLLVLSAVGDMGAFDLGGWIHRFAQMNKLDKSVRVCTALINMYAKCGEIMKAKGIFDEMPVKETASWNALINGFAVNGCAKEALELFAVMIQKGLKPNEITMLGVLSACNHCGLVEEGRRWFRAMEKFGLTPQIEHYGCVVDFLGRAGCLDEAEKLIECMPYNANEIILSSFLFSCGNFKDVKRAERVLKRTVKMEQNNGGNYVMLRNLYATEQRWTDADDIRQMMKKSGSSKVAGCSFIEVDGSFMEFVAGKYFHPNLEGVYLTLGQLWKHMKVEMNY